MKQRGSKVEYTSKQRFVSREALVAEFPNLAGALSTLDRVHSTHRNEYECSWLVRGARALGLFPGTIAACDVFYPGEIAILTADWPGEHLETEPTMGVTRFRSLLPRLMMFDASAPVDARKDKLLASFDHDRPTSVRPRVDVILLHKHPGPRPIPLSRQDLKLQRTVAETLHAWQHAFDFTMTMVALGNLHAPRDVAFVRTLGPSDVEENKVKPRRRPYTPDGRPIY